MWDYSEKVKQHFLHPKNVGEIESPEAEATVGNITCGDALKLTLRIDQNSVIRDAKFKTFGCASAIASSSALTEMIKGKTITEAEAISNRDIADFLGGLPEEKMHCSVMGKEALEKALKKYRGVNINEQEEEQDHGKLICRCFGVTDTTIRKVILANKLKTIDDVTHYCKAGGGCTSCHNDIQLILDEVNRQQAQKKESLSRAAGISKMTNIQKINLIQQTITREIAPHLRQDGGDIELIDVDGNKVIVALRGTCSGCPSAGFTLKLSVEAKLRELVSPDIIVEERK
jgi:NifU-like protein